MNLFDLLKAAGWVILPLALASVAALTLIIYCLFTLRESAILTAEVKRRLDEFFENENLDGMAAFVTDRPQAISRILSDVLKFLARCPQADADSLKAVAEASGTRQATEMQQRITYILDIGVLAPMLGLFGTVFGILKSFGQIATEATPMRTMMLAGGVSEALVATAAGLIVGITAMVAYSFFRGRVNELISLMESHATVYVQQLLLQHKRRR
jgi:biopolymer transport protein ExbB